MIVIIIVTDTPCAPHSMPVDANATEFPVWNVTVNDTAPLWFYCRQGANTAASHCGKGMVFAVNCGPDGSANSFTNFKQSALNIAIAKSKNYDDVESVIGNDWSGEEEFAEIVRAIESREGRIPRLSTTEASIPDSAAATTLITEPVSHGSDVENLVDAATRLAGVKTPPTSRTPDSTLLRAPLVPANEALMPIPAFVIGRDVQTPTPIPLPTATSTAEISSQPQ